jgi:1-deoxy-D-xylulose-5-phosphate synthase
VHKLLTGRRSRFGLLRQSGGLAGYPSQEESIHDVIENSHASTALCYADGFAKAFAARHESDRAVVAVVGDGALTGGVCWEALNNIGGASQLPIIVVLNDNGRSYAPTVGGLAGHLTELRDRASLTPPVFSSLGLAYLGPIDGHDCTAGEGALRSARQLNRPVVVHCVTQKGKGHPAAEAHEADRMHAVSAARAETVESKIPDSETWTETFGRELARIGAERNEIVAITAAMLRPTDLQHFALHRLGVTFVLDRAGVTGEDGASHNGMWDLSLLQLLPAVRIAAPRDAARLRRQLREAVNVEDGPTVLRFAMGPVDPDVGEIDRVAGLDILSVSPHPAVLIVSVGPLASVCLDLADQLAQLGWGSTVVDPGWVYPVNPAVATLAADHELVFTVEDNNVVNGVGEAIARLLREYGVDTPIRNAGIPASFLPTANRTELLARCGLTADALRQRAVSELARRRIKTRRTI